MYRVMLVDDEVHLLESMAKLVDWESCGTTLVQKAANGRIALELTQKDPPDIIVTDIKMPAMDGMKLIERVSLLFPDIKYIVLSGYGEFDYAKKAMQFGVRHYLLKPSSEDKIQEALKEIVAELEEQKKKEEFYDKINRSLSETLPKAKEQLFRELLTNKYEQLEWSKLEELFNISAAVKSYQLVFLSVDDPVAHDILTELKNLLVSEIEEVQDNVLATILSERVILLIEREFRVPLLDIIKKVQAVFQEEYELTFTAAISKKGRLSNLSKLYEDGLQSLHYKFYLGKGSIITASDIYVPKTRHKVLPYEHEEMIAAVRAGDSEKVEMQLQEFFKEIKKGRYEVEAIKAHFLKLLMLLIRQTRKEVMNELTARITDFQKLPTLAEMQDFIFEIAREITTLHFTRKKQSTNELISKIENYTERHLDEESLSISQIANTVLYMNPDYVGKLFKKETGETYSNYLIKIRMRKAMELIEQLEEVMIVEVAEKVGYGSNPRYFSQVFKKHTGFTPTEFKAIAH